MEQDTEHFSFQKRKGFDWLTALILLGIASFGLFVLLTINSALFVQQLLYIILGFFVLLFFSRMDQALLWWFAPIGYVLSILFLLLSFISPAIRGSHRWFFLGPLQLQPSELIKPFLLLGFARFMKEYSPRNIRSIPLHLVLFVLPFFLVFRQPDLGTSMVYVSMWLTMLLASGVSLVMVGLVAILAGILLPLFWFLLASYQRARILTFFYPSLDPRGSGYNAIQSMIAVGSGEWVGRGLGRGTQSHLRFLPEFHTDFIFATLVEELGFVGGIILLAGYAFLLWRIIAPLVKGRMSDLFHFSYAAGLFSMLLAQIFINAGMNMGIVPITGITLPLVSYGGSSILSVAMSFGLLWAFERNNMHTGTIAIR